MKQLILTSYSLYSQFNWLEIGLVLIYVPQQKKVDASFHFARVSLSKLSWHLISAKIAKYHYFSKH